MPKYAERPPQNGAHTHHHIVGQCCRMNASQSPSSILRRVSSNTSLSAERTPKVSGTFFGLHGHGLD